MADQLTGSHFEIVIQLTDGQQITDYLNFTFPTLIRK